MIKTAESVTCAHPDKVCDQISDAILDAYLEGDPYSRVAVEAMGGHGVVTVTGEVTSKRSLSDSEIEQIVREVYRSCGYEDAIEVIVRLSSQSPEIAQGVDMDGAGDQGIMIGYACAETPEMLPLEVVWARELTRAIGARDGKAQVTISGGDILQGVIRGNGLKPVAPIDIKIVTSVCGYDEEVRERLSEFVESIEGDGFQVEWLKNPNGSWDLGGFAADAGLTGRKIVVDAYGPRVPVGGGAFSGKDPTKVDRSGAYMARRIAVDYLKRTGASEVFCHLAYVIGIPEPAMAVVNINGKQEKVTGYDLRPSAVIDTLELRRPIYRETARLGHFGNGFAWDRV